MRVVEKTSRKLLLKKLTFSPRGHFYVRDLSTVWKCEFITLNVLKPASLLWDIFHTQTLKV